MNLGSSILSAIWSSMQSVEDVFQQEEKEKQVAELAATVERGGVLTGIAQGEAVELYGARGQLSRVQQSVRNPLVMAAVIGGAILLTTVVLSKRS